VKHLFSLAIPQHVRIRELEPLLTVREVLDMHRYRNPAQIEARRVKRVTDHQDRLQQIFSEHWGQHD
jgi:hypothetical protein